MAQSNRPETPANLLAFNEACRRADRAFHRRGNTERWTLKPLPVDWRETADSEAETHTYQGETINA
jgi:hypothetical protein